jgi:hypothetical protein
MKLIAIMGAVVALALCTASGASATTPVLCKTNTSPCPAGSAYAPGTTFSAKLKEGTSLKMTSAFETLSCTGASFGGEVTSAGVTIKTVPGFTGCTNGAGSWIVTGYALPWVGSLAAGTGGNGTLTLATSALKFIGGGQGECIMSATNVPLSITGGSPAQFELNATYTKTGSCFTPSRQIQGKFTIVSPSPAFVSVQ